MTSRSPVASRLSTYCPKQGVDIPNIEIVVQWRATCTMDALWQRFGRAARGTGTEGIAILLVESKHFDEEKTAAKVRADKRKEAAERKEQKKELGKRKRGKRAGPDSSNKRARMSGDTGTGEDPDVSASRVGLEVADDLGIGNSADSVPALSDYEALH